MRRSLPNIVLGSLALLAGCGVAGDEATEIAVRDSAGVAIVDHSGAAVAAVPLLVPGEATVSIGGESADADHDATFLQRAWLHDDGVIGFNARESRLLRFDLAGALVASHGRRGEGPDEYQFMYPIAAGGDSLLLVDVTRATRRVLRDDFTVSDAAPFAQPPAFQYDVFGMTPDGMLLAQFRPMRPPEGATGGPARRHPRPIVGRAAMATAWDTVLTVRGELVYPTEFFEGGRSYPGERMVTFGAFPYVTVWQGNVVVVDNADWTVELRGVDGALRRSIRFALPGRPMSQAIRDSVFSRDEQQMARAQLPDAVKARFLDQSRKQVFADSVAPYDRVLVGREGRLWLRLNETPVDTATVWHGLGAGGRLAVRLQLPKGWSLLATDGDRIAIRRIDDLGLGYLEVRPMVALGSSSPKP